MRLSKKGFTLVEVLVATTIGAFIVSVALCASKVVSVSAEAFLVLLHNYWKF